MKRVAVSRIRTGLFYFSFESLHVTRGHANMSFSWTNMNGNQPQCQFINMLNTVPHPENIPKFYKMHGYSFNKTVQNNSFHFGIKRFN